MEQPRQRSRWLITLLVALPCVALASCLGGGAAVVWFDAFVAGLHPDADVDALLTLIDSGELALGKPVESAWVGGHACPTWGPFQSGGHEFMALGFHHGSRNITIYTMDDKIIAAQGHGFTDRDRFGDTWFFIDLDKFNAYIDANTGGRFTRSAPLIDSAPAD